MKKLRNWLTVTMGLNLVIANVSKWHIASKIAVIINSAALMAAVFYDLLKLTDSKED